MFANGRPIGRSLKRTLLPYGAGCFAPIPYAGWDFQQLPIAVVCCHPCLRLIGSMFPDRHAASSKCDSGPAHSIANVQQNKFAVRELNSCMHAVHLLHSRGQSLEGTSCHEQGPNPARGRSKGLLPTVSISQGRGAGDGAAKRNAAPIGTLGLNRCHPCAPSGGRHSDLAAGAMESKFMDNDDHEPVADRRRGSKRGVRKKTGRLGWLCNPEVLKAVIALARLGYELVRVF